MPSPAVTWVREQAAFVVVLIVVLAGFGYLVLVPSRWGRASGLIAAGVLLAGVLRAATPTTGVGWLAVRGRVVDTASYLVVGGLLLAVDLRLHR